MNVKDKVHLLIEQANEHGGHDNIAAVLNRRRTLKNE